MLKRPVKINFPPLTIIVDFIDKPSWMAFYRGHPQPKIKIYGSRNRSAAIFKINPHAAVTAQLRMKIHCGILSAGCGECHWHVAGTTLVVRDVAVILFSE